MSMNQYNEANTTELDTYTGKSNTKYDNQNTTYYKQTSINKNNFIKMLGNDGTIEIYNGSTLIGTINKDTAIDVYGNLYINYADKNVNDITIKTSAPITEGDLKIVHTKCIKDSLGSITLEDVKDFAYLNTTLGGSATFGTDNKFINEDKHDIPFGETYTKATISLVNPASNSNVLSVTALNRDVKMEVVLRRNAEHFDLYRNPVIQIELPEYIEEINLKGNVQVNFADGLQLEGTASISKIDGKNILRLALTGDQKTYTMQNIEGTRITITADMKVNLSTPSTTEKVKLYYHNEKAVAYTEEDEMGKIDSLDAAITTADIAFQANTGMLGYNEISNFDDLGTTVTSLSIDRTAEETVGRIDANNTERTAKMTIGLVNNNSSECTDIKILGKIPFEGNKYGKDGEVLNSNFDTILKSGIQIPTESGLNAKVYYSTNGEAKAENAGDWVENPSDLSNIKSYLIVLEGYVMPVGKTLEFSYDFEIPENLKLNNKSFGTFIATFTRKVDGVTTPDFVEPEKVGIGTDAGPNLEISKSVDVGNNTEVREHQVIKYSITVKNTGTLDATDVVIKDKIPDGTTYVEQVDGQFVEKTLANNEKTFDIGELKVGEENAVTRYFYVKINKLPGTDTTGEVKNTAKVSASNLPKDAESNEVKNPVKKASIQLEKFTAYEDGFAMAIGQEFVYQIRLTNVSGQEIKKGKITDELPQGLTYISSSIYRDKQETDNDDYNETTRTVTWDVGTVKVDEVILAKVKVKVDQLKSTEYEKTFINEARFRAENIDEPSNKVTFYTYGPKLEITKTSNSVDKDVKEGQTIEYTITVKNTGKGTAYGVTTKDKLPAGVTFVSADRKITGTKPTGEIFWDEMSLAPNASLTYKVIATVDYLAKSEKTKEINNIATVRADNYDKEEQAEKLHIVQKGEELTISGLVWLDENKDGKRDDNEKKLPNIEVILVSADTTSTYRAGEVIKNKITGEEQRMLTSADGTYLFDNLEKGNYYVVFLFNGKIYGVTKHIVAGVPENINSDAIYNENIKDVDGTIKTGAIVDPKIELVDKSKYNIDLGLIPNPIFDLSLDKYVNRVTVKNKEGTKTIDYQNAKLAKVDIKDQYMQGSELTIEYLIVVVNQGDVAGFAKNIIDNLPKDLTFNQSENTGWSKASNGNLNYTGLENSIIQPGESKEIKLIVTKKLDSNSTVTLSNTAEIYQDYNESGLKDVDSTPNNGAQDEDDFGRADILVTIKTGQTVMYFTLTLTIVAMLGVGVYMIKKKVLV